MDDEEAERKARLARKNIRLALFLAAIAIGIYIFFVLSYA